MTKTICMALALSVTIGLIAGLAAGPLPGVGTFALVAVAGAMAVVLWRNHRDRKELERRLVRVPVHRVVGDETLVRRPLCFVEELGGGLS